MDADAEMTSQLQGMEEALWNLPYGGLSYFIMFCQSSMFYHPNWNLMQLGELPIRISLNTCVKKKKKNTAQSVLAWSWFHCQHVAQFRLVAQFMSMPHLWWCFSVMVCRQSKAWAKNDWWNSSANSLTWAPLLRFIFKRMGGIRNR